MSTVNIIYNAVVIFALFMGAEDHATVQYCSISNTKWEHQGWAYVLFKRTQHSCVLLRSFQKNATFSRSFAFFIKRTLRSLRSFTFFIKERSVLCVLLRSL